MVQPSKKPRTASSTSSLVKNQGESKADISRHISYHIFCSHNSGNNVQQQTKTICTNVNQPFQVFLSLKLATALNSDDKFDNDIDIIEELSKVQFPAMFSRPLFLNGKMALQFFDEILHNYSQKRLLQLFQVYCKPTFVCVEICILLLMEFFTHPVISYNSIDFQMLPLYHLWNSKIRGAKSRSFQSFLWEHHFMTCHLWTDLIIRRHIEETLGFFFHSCMATHYNIEALVFDDDDYNLNSDDG
jgi:hypothetical protein